MVRITLGMLFVLFLMRGTGYAESDAPFYDESLLEAARKGDEGLFRVLLDKGGNPRRASIFEAACVSGNVAIARILVEKNVVPSAAAVDRCLFYGHREMAVYLNGVLKNTKQGEVDIKARCRMTPDSGVCMAAFDRAYFNPLVQACFKFIYGGCGGAAPFSSLEACKRVCEE